MIKDVTGQGTLHIYMISFILTQIKISKFD